MVFEMKFKKKLLSSILAGTCMFSSSANKEKTRGMEVVVGGIFIASFIGLVGYGIYRAYKDEQARKAEISRRHTLVNFTSAPARAADIARELIYKIPCTSFGNSMFDSLLSCRNDEDITRWSALIAANSGWGYSTLGSISGTLQAYKIECDVLQNKVLMKREDEKDQAKLELEDKKSLRKYMVANRKISSDERIADKKIDSVERENEKDRVHDTKKQIRQQVHEHYMQDKQHWHENDMKYGGRGYGYYW